MNPVTNFLAAHVHLLEIFGWIILTVGLIQNLVLLLQMPAAWLELREKSTADDTETSWQILMSEVAPPISVIVPAFNEALTIVANLQALLALKYTALEVVVVNDGSKDDTLQILVDTFDLERVNRAYEERTPHGTILGLYASKSYGRLLVVDKENGGSKADAINAGIDVSRNDLFCVVDADSLLEGDALLNAVRPFIDDPEEVVAVGGTVRVVNGSTVRGGRVVDVGLPSNLLARIQFLEYIRAFLITRLAWSRWGALSIISGAFGIFRRDIALAVGGYSLGTVGEDYDFIIKMHRYMCDHDLPYVMRFVPEPVCWTEAPENLKTLANQRKRWQRGALETFFAHRTMLLNPRYGRFGMLAFLNNLFVDIVEPITEILGLIVISISWAAGALNSDFLLAFLALFVVFGIFVSISSLLLEEMALRRVNHWKDLLGLAWVSVFEHFGFRQINNYWRIVGWIEYLRRKESWGEMKRKGVKAT